LQLKDVTVKAVLDEIEHTSEFIFIFRTDAVDLNRKVNVEVRNKTIDYIMNILFGSTDNHYEVIDRQVIINTKPAKQSISSGESVVKQPPSPITVFGVVQDASGMLPGVNVMVKGTTNGVVTDATGKFTITVPDGDAVLVFSSMGYTTQNLMVGNQTNIKVTLSEGQELEEVVVIGYGNMKKSDLSGATVSVSSEKLMSSISSGLDHALIGRAAGVAGIRTSGQPGASVSIRIRGTSTLNADAEPLYVVDGVPISSSYDTPGSIGLGDLGQGKSSFSALATINPADIHSIEILKDASATAIYGSRGANGVVLITTKRGKANETRVNYEGYFGLQHQVRRLDIMNLSEFAAYQNDVAAESESRVPDPYFADPSLLGEGTDWQSAIFQTAPMQSHQLTASGGSEKAQYALGVGYFDQEGTLIGSKFRRLNARINLDSQARKWLKIGNSLALSTSKDDLGLSEDIIRNALVQAPDVPVYNLDGTYAGSAGEGNKGNPIGKALDENHQLNRFRATGNIYADISILKGLVWRSEIGGDINYSEAKNFRPTYIYGQSVNEQNSVDRRNNKNIFWQIKNYATYNLDLSQHHVTAMVGHEVSEWKYETLYGYSQSLASNDIQFISLGDPKSMVAADGSGSGSMVSLFTRWNYNFKSLYFLTFTLRADGSSNFSSDNQWGYFPSVATSWRISEEQFMESIRPVVNNLKLRLGWGQNGNQNIGSFRWGASMQKVNTNLGMGYRQQNIANPELKWETSEQTNIGLDVSFLNNRLTLAVDYYDKRSKDMLLQLPLPSYMGTSGSSAFKLQSPYVNLGEISNKGLEITLVISPTVLLP
jgi:TonB-linked SusC/RagA family outer membrane protein